MDVVDARPAASVLLLRDAAAGVEILFVRRAAELKFMGGAWVFPGGGLEPDDGDIEHDETWRSAAVREAEEEAGIQLPDPELLVPFSRWITPELVPIRFDTRFYLAETPAGQTAVPDGREVDRAAWWTAAHALELAEREQEELHFPTVKQLEQLTGFQSTAEALAAQAGRVIEAILPRVALRDDGFDVLLPGDPGYADA